MGKAEPVEVAGSLPSDLSALEWAEHLGLAGSVYQNAGGETLQRTVKTREWEIMTSVRESGTDKSEGAGIGLMPISTDLPELQEQASLDLATVTYIGILLALSVLRVLVWRRFEWQPSPPRINRSIEE